MADYAIIGFGCAGYYGAKAIRENDPDGTIAVYSEHGYSPYNPMLTTYYVAGKIPFEGLFPFGDMEKIRRPGGKGRGPEPDCTAGKWREPSV